MMMMTDVHVLVVMVTVAMVVVAYDGSVLAVVVFSAVMAMIV